MLLCLLANDILNGIHLQAYNYFSYYVSNKFTWLFGIIFIVLWFYLLILSHFKVSQSEFITNLILIKYLKV